MNFLWAVVSLPFCLCGFHVKIPWYLLYSEETCISKDKSMFIYTVCFWWFVSAWSTDLFSLFHSDEPNLVSYRSASIQCSTKPGISNIMASMLFFQLVVVRSDCHCSCLPNAFFLGFLSYPNKQFTSVDFPIPPSLATMVFWAVPLLCCRLYCYKCAARVTMPMATNEWYFFRYSLVLWW